MRPACRDHLPSGGQCMWQGLDAREDPVALQGGAAAGVQANVFTCMAVIRASGPTCSPTAGLVQADISGCQRGPGSSSGRCSSRVSRPMWSPAWQLSVHPARYITYCPVISACGNGWMPERALQLFRDTAAGTPGQCAHQHGSYQQHPAHVIIDRLVIMHAERARCRRGPAAL